MPDTTPSLLTTYGLTPEQAGALPPELRDQLLDFVGLWGTPEEILSLLADVFILPEHRGRGLSKWMVATVKSHPSLQGIRRWLLFTADAHGLYAQFGFVADPAAAERLMTWRDPAYEELVAKLDGKEA